MPYPNFHSARIRQPGLFVRIRQIREAEDGAIRFIGGPLKSTGTVAVQAVRFEKGKYTPAQARAWLKDHEEFADPILFEEATKEYSADDLDELRKILRCPMNTPIFVGHNPMWKWGGNKSVWVDILRTHDYVILYSGAQDICPYISVKNSFDYEIKYAHLKLKKKRFVLDN